VRSNVGDGTSIILTLPRAENAADEVADGAAAEKRLSSASGRLVLLVEDSQEVAMVATAMLEDLGFAVRRTASAPEALKLLRDGLRVHLVFSDIVMPGGMSGIDLAQELKRSRPDLPVLLTTGYSEAVRERDGLDGFQLLAKPFSLQALETALIAAGQD
jgi:CheY-like chemotaxis protein